MATTPILTHAADAKGKLLSQFQDKPNLTALIGLLATQVQLLENAANQMPAGCFLANAIGAQLDGIGKVVGQPRISADDATYSLFLRGKIAANSSHGDHETLLALVASLFEASSVSLRGSFAAGGAPLQAPAALGVEIGAPALPVGLFSVAIALLRQAMPSGVLLSYVTEHADADAFALDGPTSGLGLASDDSTVSGGQLASDLYTSTQG